MQFARGSETVLHMESPNRNPGDAGGGVFSHGAWEGPDMSMRFTEIGQQLRAYRLESGLRAEEIAARLPEIMLPA